MWQFGEKLEGFLSVRGDTQGNVRLLGNDDDTDGGKHAMDGSDGEELAQGAEFEGAEQNLDDTGNDANRDGALITEHGVAFTESLDGTKNDDDHSCGGSFDREFGVAQERGDETSENGREDACDGREAGCDGDAEAKRQGDEEDEES